MTLTDIIAKITLFAKQAFITDNSSGDALRITQTGSGNALRVNDATHPDVTPFCINADGRVLSGSETILDAFRSGKFNAYHQGGEVAFVGIRYSDDALGTNLALGKSRSATIGVEVIPQVGDTVGSVEFTATDGTSYIQAASIKSTIDATPGTNDMPGAIIFSTTPNGSTSPVERLKISSTGTVRINRQDSSGEGAQLEFARSLDNGLSWVIDVRSTTNEPRFRFIAVDGSTTKEVFAAKHSGTLSMPILPTYANNAAAITGGLIVGDVYKTSTGELRIVV